MNSHQRHIARRKAEADLAAAEGAKAAAVAEAERRAVCAELELDRWRERALRAEASVAELRVQRGNLEEQVASVAAELAEITDQAIVAAAELTERERDIAALMVTSSARADEVSAPEAELERLQVEDRDASKLRRRLAERGRELEQAQVRIRELEASRRAAAAAATPMIDWKRSHG